MRRNSLIPLLVLLLTAACSRPQGDHRFISTETARGNGGAFVFEMESEDSAAVFTTTLAARIVASRIPEKTLEFDIHLTPPDGQTSIERHTFPLTEEPGVRISLGAGSVTDYEWPWREIRTGGHPVGTWTVRITPSDPARLEALSGVGFSYQAKTWEKAN
ncbi:MAG: hypothetical protein IKQ01_01315 [Bacteroidales bacterium]|nr:hypothetical protein [Bacteroidales bacterium]MBR4351690.1 hypothetical protein [Bacteroidales bacterium]